MPHLLIILLIGALAGWIAGSIVESETGFLADILIGIVGGWLGYKLFGHMLNITANRFVNEVITATAGAIILSLAIKILRKLFR